MQPFSFIGDSMANKLLLWIRPVEGKYISKLETFRFSAVRIVSESYHSWMELRMEMRRLGCNCVATTRSDLWNSTLEGTAEDNLGYVFKRDGITCMYLPHLERMYSESHMTWLINHWLCKLSNPEVFVTADTFSYTVFDELQLSKWEDMLNSPQAVLAAVDIETQKESLLITSCAITVLMQTPKGIKSHSTAINLMQLDTTDVHMNCLRLLLRSEVPKLFHNGRYDCSYLLRYNAIPVAYYLDTYHMQHCLYSELKKSLAFCTQLYVLGIRYWKEMSAYNKLEYNARDTHATAWVWLGMMQHIKWQKAQYAIANYKIEFPAVIPSIYCGLDGLKVDEATRLALRAKEVVKRDTALGRLRYILGEPKFNPNSPVHVLNLIHALGYRQATATDKKTMQHFAERGEFEAFIVRLIQSYRKAVKAISTYFDVELLNGLLLFSIDPAGTETGRMASSESHFWCGTQIQNIPPYAKPMIVAPDGWLFAAVDGSQAESRCTAYISGDTQLIHNVETSPDFHCTNCSMFFGMPFEELYSVEKKKVLRKDIRNVGKRVNHGANYNMGATVLWETMGDKEVFRAARLLDLPLCYTAIKITSTLLKCFNATYPKIKGEWYGKVVEEVRATGKLVGATGWTRRTFNRPWLTKPELNSCVAHPPQSLSVMGVNKAFVEVWKRQISDMNGRIRLRMQIHDELVVCHKPDDLEPVYMLADIFMRCNTVTIKGKTMVIPCEPKHSAKSWGELKE